MASIAEPSTSSSQNTQTPDLHDNDDESSKRQKINELTCSICHLDYQMVFVIKSCKHPLCIECLLDKIVGGTDCPFVSKDFKCPESIMSSELEDVFDFIKSCATTVNAKIAEHVVSAKLSSDTVEAKELPDEGKSLRLASLLESPVLLLTETLKENEPSFEIDEIAPTTHHYIKTKFEVNLKAVCKEHKSLAKSLPPGIFVRSFEDRLDLLCAMIEGPSGTPYEGGLFLFDIQLPEDYPQKAPQFHFISFTAEKVLNYESSFDRLNPNLYQNGKVCVSLLGTWKGQGNENWNPESTLLQVLVSIQGLILVNEPYFNEPGFEDEKGVPGSEIYSRIYNESVILRVADSMNKLMVSVPPVFHKQIIVHVHNKGKKFFKDMVNIFSKDQHINSTAELSADGAAFKDFTFPIFPLSKQFFSPMTHLLTLYASRMMALINEPVTNE